MFFVCFRGTSDGSFAVQLEEEMVYDEVSEEEYRRIVSDRRDGDSFVVDGGISTLTLEV